MKTRAKRFVSALLAGVLCLSLLAGCASKKKELTRYSTVFYDVFDTVTQVIAYCESEEEFNTQMDALHADLITYNQLYDIYNDYPGVTNVKTINDNAGSAPVEVDDRILSMLELADQMYQTTNGKLNIAMGSVLNIWHNYREAAEAAETDADNKLPTMEELEAAAQHCDINNVIIDADAKTVYLADPEMLLDVGSVGKGYAVEMVCQAAEARGLTSALVSVGGNLRAIGVKPDGSQWTGGVENPWSSSDVYTSDSMLDGAINMSDMALVTSGDYQRYYVVDGKRYHHLIDPDTLFPAAYFNGVTVLCSDSGLADCLTTGLFCQPLEDGMKIVESLDGVEAMWCTPDQQVITSSGWDSHLKKHWLAAIYALFGVLTVFGTGNATQVNTITTAIDAALNQYAVVSDKAMATVNLVIGIVVAMLVAMVLLGGVKRIGSVSEKLVPFMALTYVVLALGVVLLNLPRVPAVFASIVVGAFNPAAFTGGAVGSLFLSMQKGVSRGIFSNEAGLGTGSIAHACADTKKPVKQGMFGIFEVFADTIVICTLTALVILCSGTPVNYGAAAGAELTISGFTLTYGGWASLFTAVALCCFAFSTIIGWGLYGSRCIEYLFHTDKVVRPFLVVYSFVAILGATVDLGLLWSIADTFNGLMSIPNLIALLLLSSTVVKLVKEFFAKEPQ